MTNEVLDVFRGNACCCPEDDCQKIATETIDTTLGIPKYSRTRIQRTRTQRTPGIQRTEKNPRFFPLERINLEPNLGSNEPVRWRQYKSLLIPLRNQVEIRNSSVKKQREGRGKEWGTGNQRKIDLLHELICSTSPCRRFVKAREVIM